MEYRYLGNSGLQVSALSFGRSRLQQVTENMAAMEVVERLTPDVLEQIEEIADNKPKAEPDWR